MVLDSSLSEVVKLTDQAIDRIRELKKKKLSFILKLSVLGGGCSGFQYRLEETNLEVYLDSSDGGEVLDEDDEWDHNFGVLDNKSKSDIIIRDNNSDILAIIDSKSLEYIKNSKIDYVSDDFEGGFVIKNPNVQSSCGCGNSFAL